MQNPNELVAGPSDATRCRPAPIIIPGLQSRSCQTPCVAATVGEPWLTLRRSAIRNFGTKSIEEQGSSLCILVAAYENDVTWFVLKSRR